MKKSFILIASALTVFQLVSCDTTNPSKNTQDSEALLQIGKYMMERSINKASNAIAPAMTPADISEYKNQHAFPGVLVYWAGLLEKREGFDCSDKIIKFEYNVRYKGEEKIRTLGIQTNITLDKENNEVLFRATQGEGADSFYAFIGVKVSYDFETKTIGDYFLLMGSLNETYTKLTSVSCYAKEGDTFKVGTYEDCAETVDEIANPYIEMIPNATLAEKEDARNYMSDYCAAGDYYASIGGKSIITLTLAE